MGEEDSQPVQVKILKMRYNRLRENERESWLNMATPPQRSDIPSVSRAEIIFGDK